ncbi:hypothetical protein [Litoreibacter roseus]|uniref:Uncharacterized protein n=1 Tax=Litoreibacter roseus TaxID=2601869 RepID=A0A6N6JD46_9RHOB|nr:hypothetical protein [Litoreibacter roseus]GFE63907.1 hypothetical protein KIN_09810 [Litoreibacter roseus]
MARLGPQDHSDGIMKVGKAQPKRLNHGGNVLPNAGFSEKMRQRTRRILARYCGERASSGLRNARP